MHNWRKVGPRITMICGAPLTVATLAAAERVVHLALCCLFLFFVYTSMCTMTSCMELMTDDGDVVEFGDHCPGSVTVCFGHVIVG